MIKSLILNLFRLAVGALFMFSGFVKCVDPMGGAIKIGDYFVAWGVDASDLVTVLLSFVQNVVEFMAGFMLILNLFVPASSLVAMLFMIFFTPLTLYIALVNPVSDCGCFGDAVKLTNWQTFFKNLIFLPMSIAVFAQRGLFTSSLRPWKKALAICVGLLISFCVSLQGLTSEPFIDFRPYSVGVDIRRAMDVPEDAAQPEYRTTFILERDGQMQEFDEHTYPYDDPSWKFIDSRTEIISEGYVPDIHDFTFTDESGEVFTDELLNSSTPIILAISPKVENIAPGHLQRLKEIMIACENSDARFFVATSSVGAALRQMENSAEAGFNFLQADETMLKTITRSNPGIFALQNGVVVAKYHIDHVTSADALSRPMSTYLAESEAQRVHLTLLAIIFATGISLLLLYKKHKRK